MRSMFITMVLGVGLFVGLSTVHGCGKVDEVFDCQSVCSRYRDCYQADYDVAKCRDNCRTRSDNDPSVRAAADACETCIDEKSCLSAPFSCGASCSAIVP